MYCTTDTLAGFFAALMSSIIFHSASLQEASERLVQVRASRKQQLRIQAATRTQARARALSHTHIHNTHTHTQSTWAKDGPLGWRWSRVTVIATGDMPATVGATGITPTCPNPVLDSPPKDTGLTCRPWPPRLSRLELAYRIATSMLSDKNT
jgi:hypothetical protein